MPRFFWIALAIGYGLGLLGAAFFLPSRLLVPVLGHLATLTLIGTVSLFVFHKRHDREDRKDGRLKLNFRIPSDIASRLHSLGREILDFFFPDRGQTQPVTGLDLTSWREPVAKIAGTIPQVDSRRISPLLSLSAASWEHIDEKPEVTPQMNTETRTAQSSGRAKKPIKAGNTQETDKSGLRCTATPIMMVPQRRWIGLHVQGQIAITPKRSIGRDRLQRSNVPKSKLRRFDEAVLQRALAMMEIHAGDLIDREILVETSLGAVFRNDTLSRLNKLAEDPLNGGVTLVVAAETEELNRFRSQCSNLPNNLMLAVNITEPASFDLTMAGGVPFDYALVRASAFSGRIDVPLDFDPINLSLQNLVENQVRVMVSGVNQEESLLDALDYPIGEATGRLFGKKSAVLSDGSCTYFTFDETDTGSASSDADDEKLLQPAD